MEFLLLQLRILRIQKMQRMHVEALYCGMDSTLILYFYLTVCYNITQKYMGCTKHIGSLWFEKSTLSCIQQ